MTVGDGPLSDFPGLRARLARVPILDEGYPAAESLKQVRDGCLSFLGRDWPADALTGSGVWFHDPITGRRWAGPEHSAFDVDVRSTGVGIGDVKYVWEPNRLQILHPLAASIARGGRAGDRDVGLAVLRSWAAANPPYR